MKRARRITLCLLIALLTLAFVVTLAACGGKKKNNNNNSNNDDSDNNSPYMTEAEITDLLASAKIDFSGNIMIEEGGNTVAINGNNFYKVENGTSKGYIVLKDGVYYMISDDTDPINPVSQVARAQKWEVDTIVQRAKSSYEDFDLAALIDEYKAGTAKFKYEMGDDYVEKAEGYKADNGYSLNLTITVASSYGEGIPYKYNMMAQLDSDKRLISLSYNSNPMEGWYGDNTNASDLYSGGGSTSFKYGDEATVSFPDPSDYTSVDLDPETQKVTLSFGNHAVMPDGFQNSVAPGSTVSLPNPVNNTANFLGWYYDGNLTMPVENGQLAVSFANPSQRVYAKWAQKIELNFNGGNLDAYYNARKDCVFTLSDIKQYIYPTLDGYEFVGWYKDAGFTQPVEYSDDALVTETTKLYAKYEKLVGIKVVNNSNYKTLTKYGVKGEGFYIDDPEKKGYIFDGWYTDPDFDTEFDHEHGYKFPSNDVTIYAKYHEGLAINIDVCYTGNFSKPAEVPNYINVEKNTTVAQLEEQLHYFVVGDGQDFFGIYDDPNDPSFNAKKMLRWAADKNGTKITNVTSGMTVYAYRTNQIPVRLKTFKDGTLSYNDDSTISLQSLFYSGTSLYDAVTAYVGNQQANDSTLNNYDCKIYTDSGYTQEFDENFTYGDSSFTIFIVYTQKLHYTFNFRNGGKYWQKIDEFSASEMTSSREAEGLYYSYIAEEYGNPRAAFIALGLVSEDNEHYNEGSGYIVADDAEYYFAGWYTDPELTHYYNYNTATTMPTESITLYAQYERITKIYLENGTEFADVVYNQVPTDISTEYDTINEVSRYYITYLSFARSGKTFFNYIVDTCCGQGKFTGRKNFGNGEVDAYVISICKNAACTDAIQYHLDQYFPADGTIYYLGWVSAD